MRTLLCAAVIASLVMITYAQEQGYLTNGKERLRAEVNAPSENLPPPPVSLKNQMIGAVDTNEPNRPAPAMENRQLANLLVQMEQEHNKLTMQETQLLAELQRIKRLSEQNLTRGSTDVQHALDILMAKQQQLANDRRAWYDLYRYNFQTAVKSNQTQKTISDLRGLEDTQNSSDNINMRQQQRQQSDITGIESK